MPIQKNERKVRLHDLISESVEFGILLAIVGDFWVHKVICYSILFKTVLF
jgi:hypothetical protein